jgi:hypothetical protein
MRLRAAPLALAGVVGLACLNVWLLASALQAPAPEPDMKAPAAALDPAASPAASQRDRPRPRLIAAYGQTLAKPVFFKTRAPYVPPPPAPPPSPKPVSTPPPVPADPGLVLGGVMVAEQAKKAYIFNKVDQRGGWFGEGETILGWKVELIDAAAARLRQGDRSIELQLYPKDARSGN